jgi:DNA-binding transcriptional LysR family regulator
LPGAGYAWCPRNFAAAALAAGQLQNILGDWTLPPLKTYALVPNRSLLPTKTRLLLDGLEQHFAATEPTQFRTAAADNKKKDVS